MSIGPGSAEGFREQMHWHGVNRALSAVEKAWLIDQASTRQLHNPVEVKRWILGKGRTRAHAEQLCKRWGVEMPTREELVAQRDKKSDV